MTIEPTYQGAKLIHPIAKAQKNPQVQLMISDTLWDLPGPWGWVLHTLYLKQYMVRQTMLLRNKMCIPPC